MQTIEDFVDRIITEKNFNTKDPEVLAQIRKDLLERIGTRVDAMIMANIPEDKLSEFDAVLDTKDQQKISEFIRAQIPDIDEKTAAVLLSFRTIYTSE